MSEKAQPISLEFKGLKKSVTLGDGKCITLHTENPDAENTLDNPNLITPKESSISIEGNTLNTEIGAMTFAVYKFKKKANNSSAFIAKRCVRNHLDAPFLLC